MSLQSFNFLHKKQPTQDFNSQDHYNKVKGQTRPMHRRTIANLYPPKRQLTKASEPSFDLHGGAQDQI